MGIRQTFAGEPIARISGPTAGKVTAHGAVVTGLRAGGKHFRAVKELRGPAHGGQQGHGDIEPLDVLINQAVQSAGIVVLGKNDQTHRVRVEVVIRQGFVDANQPAIPRFVFRQCGAQGVVHGEIHYAGKIGHITVFIVFAALPIGHHIGVGAPLLTDNIEVGVFRHNAAGPLGQEILVGVGIGIGTDAIKIRVLNPPDAVLNQVIGHQRVALVQVRHGFHKPTVGKLLFIDVRRVRILNAGPVMGGGDEFVLKVQPVVGGQIVHPPVAGSDVVENHILNQADAFGFALQAELSIVLIVTKARIYPIEVGNGVTVVGILGLIIFQHGGWPDGGKAHVRDVIQVLDQPGQVAAVTADAAVPVRGFFELGKCVIARVAVGKTIRGDQINGIGGVEAVAVGGVFPAGVERIVMLEIVAVFMGKLQGDSPALKGAANVKIDKQIIFTLDTVHIGHRNLRMLQAYRPLGNPVAVNHQLYVGIAHARPPERRIDAVNGIGKRGGYSKEQGEE